MIMTRGYKRRQNFQKKKQMRIEIGLKEKKKKKRTWEKERNMTKEKPKILKRELGKQINE